MARPACGGARGTRLLLALAACACAGAAAAVPDAPPEACTDRIRASTKWGVATAAYQIEGAWNVSRTPSVWDTFSHVPGNIKGNATGDVACDHFHRFKEDFRLMADLGIKHYRFSISWGRILTGDGGRGSAVNPAGVAFYNALLDEMEAHGITPAATMFHWDLPQALHDKYRGPLSPEFVADFEHYADALFSSFPRIREWMTFNEPLITCDASYGVGKFAPGYKGGTEGIYACAHHVLLAHAAVKHLSRTRYAKLKHRVGIALNVEWAEPMTNSAEDKAAAQRNLDVQLGTFADPLFLGHYPPYLKQRFGAAIREFTPAEAKRVRGSLDFVGINFYTGKFVKGNGSPLGYIVSSWGSSGREIGPLAASGWLRVYPEGIYKVTQYVTKRYGRPEIRITENGVSAPGEAGMPVDRAAADAFRVNYYRDYLGALCRSKADGARITEYYAWSFMDNFEWLQGYSERFGVVHVDFATQTRTAKDSARYLSQHFFRAN